MAPIDETPRAYIPLEVPDFVSVVPPYLLEGRSESERYILETLSRIDQSQAWIRKQLVLTDLTASEALSKVDALEKWKQYFSGKWAVLGLLGLSIMSAILAAVIDAFMTSIKHKGGG